ncbi:fluoride efflux transporter FluC [Candidatus Methanomassiliicoccus intestinalis]|uniref:fluoride efflux transporter FluC n=1 Tax=Candidatus Methanomassiliicoccus intestinalis TaxID=1406512 RepID=UPI0037DC6276
MLPAESAIVVLAVFLGGGIGAVLRLGITTFILEKVSSIFPFGTFIVNISGTFAIGFIATILLSSDYELLRLFLITGILGGYTTYSTYELESAQLFRKNKVIALIYWLGSVIIGILTACLGIMVAEGLM